MAAISPSTWRDLFELARKFRQMEPWTWMYDSDLFGVQHPDTKEIGICCIMGHQGAFFGMAVYKGVKGLNSYEQLVKSQNIEDFSGTPYYEQECLMLSFNTKDELYLEELELLRELDLVFDGPSHWPAFRDYTTGYMPWPIQTEAEAQFLLYALKGAMAVCEMVQKEGGTVLEDPDGFQDRLFIQIPKMDTGELDWDRKWMLLPPYAVKNPEIEVNRLYLLSNCSHLPRTQSAWLVNIFYYPIPNRDHSERPFFPQILIVVDMESGKIIGHETFRKDEMESQLAYAFAKITKEAGVLPASLLVSDYEDTGYWEKITQILKLPLEVEGNDHIVKEIKDSLLRMLP